MIGAAHLFMEQEQTPILLIPVPPLPRKSQPQVFDKFYLDENMKLGISFK